MIAMTYYSTGLRSARAHSISCETSALAESGIVVGADTVLRLLVDGQEIERQVWNRDVYGSRSCYDIVPIEPQPASIELVGAK